MEIGYLVHASYDSELHFSKQSNFREAYFLDSWFGDESGARPTLEPSRAAAKEPSPEQGFRQVESRPWDR